LQGIAKDLGIDNIDNIISGSSDQAKKDEEAKKKEEDKK
jgi:hypothetical protein